MFGAFHSTGWVQTVRTVLIAVVIVFGSSLLPSSAEAQERPPTWPAFPRTVAGTPGVFEANADYGFTAQHFNVAYCYPRGNEMTCQHTGVEQGSSPAVVITSRCQYASRPEGQVSYLSYCQVDFSDNRYRVFFETSDNWLSGSTVEIVAEVQRSPFGNDNEIGRQRRVTDFNLGVIPDDWQDDGEGGGNGGDTDPGVGETPATAADATQPSRDNSCDIGTLNLADCLGGIVAKLGASVLWLFVQVFMILLGFVGVLFNWIVVVTVFQYATYFGNSEGLLMAWSVLRDLGNIFLLFGFIFIGLQTILNIGHFSVGKALPRLLIFAILINFSLFVSSAIVDISNVFSAGFYSGISGGVNCGAPAEGETTREECTGTGISGKIQAAAGLGNIGDSSGGLDELWQGDGTSMFIVYFCLLIFGIIMLVVLLAACIMLLIRAITLMFLLVLSPLGFAATAIPQFEELSKMWWKKLISQAFFAPAFLLMLFVGLKIMEGANRTFNPGNGASLTSAFADGGTSAGGIFISFALTIGFMIGALMVASQMGAMGASFATRQAGGIVFGGISGAFKHTVGKQMHNMAEKQKNDGRKRTGFSKFTSDMIAKGGAASYDPRGIGLVGAGAKAGHLDLGKSKTGGYTKILHDEEEAHKKYAKGLKNSPEELAQIAALEASIKKANTSYATMSAEMRERHKADKELVRALKDIEMLSAQTRAARERGQIDEKAERALSNAYSERDTVVARQSKEAEEAKQAHERAVEVFKVGEDGKGGIKGLKEKPQREYATNIQKPPPYIPKVIYNNTVYGEAAHHAGHSIESDLDKDENKRLLDALTGVREGLAKGSGGGGGGDKKEDDHAH